MAFKIIKITERDPKDFCNHLIFDLQVSISQDGMFKCYLPDNIVELFKKSGIEVHLNPGRRSKEGFYMFNTLEGLISQIQADISEYFSRELIESKIVIRYKIATTCAYSINSEGKIVPNCYEVDWGKEDEDLNWRHGTESQDAAHSNPYGILVYAKPFNKKTYRYKSGIEKVELEGYYTNGHSFKEGRYLYYLASFASMSVPSDRYEDGEQGLAELNYTEDVAKFFVDLLTSICNLNEKIKNLLSPEELIKVIESGQKLLQ